MLFLCYNAIHHICLLSAPRGVSNRRQCVQLQVVLARAEALAKAEFAHKRDAHDCALMYVALKKKQLLLVGLSVYGLTVPYICCVICVLCHRF